MLFLRRGARNPDIDAASHSGASRIRAAFLNFHAGGRRQCFSARAFEWHHSTRIQSCQHAEFSTDAKPCRIPFGRVHAFLTAAGISSLKSYFLAFSDPWILGTPFSVAGERPYTLLDRHENSVIWYYNLDGLRDALDSGLTLDAEMPIRGRPENMFAAVFKGARGVGGHFKERCMVFPLGGGLLPMGGEGCLRLSLQFFRRL